MAKPVWPWFFFSVKDCKRLCCDEAYVLFLVWVIDVVCLNCLLWYYYENEFYFFCINNKIGYTNNIFFKKFDINQTKNSRNVTNSHANPSYGERVKISPQKISITERLESDRFENFLLKNWFHRQVACTSSSSVVLPKNQLCAKSDVSASDNRSYCDDRKWVTSPPAVARLTAFPRPTMTVLRWTTVRLTVPSAVRTVIPGILWALKGKMDSEAWYLETWTAFLGIFYPKGVLSSEWVIFFIF